MNAKLNRFYDLFREHFQEGLYSEDKEIFVVFDELNDEEKLLALDCKPKEQVINFLKKWSEGISIGKSELAELRSKFIEEISNQSLLGGHAKSKTFLESALNANDYEALSRRSKEIRFQEDEFPFFSELLNLTIDETYSLIKEEDPIVIAIVIETMAKREKTKQFSASLKAMFDENLPKIKRRVSNFNLREIERVLDAKIHGRLLV